MYFLDPPRGLGMELTSIYGSGKIYQTMWRYTKNREFQELKVSYDNRDVHQIVGVSELS